MWFKYINYIEIKVCFIMNMKLYEVFEEENNFNLFLCNDEFYIA